MGVPLRTLYGQTELLGAYTLHREDGVDPDTTGVPMADDIEIRIDNPDVNGVGEIVVRHPNMFLGYYKMRPPLPTSTMAGCAQAMPATSTATGNSSSSTVSRTWRKHPAATISRRNISRTN